ncbi:VWA domain-containing protein [Occallatibacter riparius]|uniref:VWA domain-containing protein n=1 Tax=Occallatibacter riparius TaxID=1002689 RepID=A0A9J7BYP1_9BACT|nr:VWA domain-containing protein [Occallatibacter riparius]UWZ86645.1 VWA domain-containing protein [Occallatibacter riparius]
MRRLIILGFAVFAALPAWAAHRVSVSQLEQTLAADATKHRNDFDIARQLSDLQLSERLTAHTKDRLISSYALEAHAALALELLADESAVLDPPRNELPATATPDAATQKRILAAAQAYVVETIPRLPNFFATRSTVRFDDSAQVVREGEWPIRAGFHLIGNASRTVTMRDGQEVTDSPQQAAARPEQIMGLHSFGEFGPILARTLADLARGKIQFSHWEGSPLGVAAVFHYSVPRHESHYRVHYCCLMNQEFQGGPSYRNRNLPRYHSADQNPVETSVGNPYDATPAYHGTLAIEPASGAIVRLTLDAELDPENAITRASTVVEYARVVIGDQPFICPVRSLAISSQQGPPPAGEGLPRMPVLAINETSFTQYHRLGSSARLIASAAVPDAAAAGAAVSSPQPVTDAGGTAVQKSAEVTESSTPSAAVANADPAQPASDPPARSQSTVVVERASAVSIDPASAPASSEPEISMSDPGPLPDVPAAHTAMTAEALARTVCANLIALDKKGHPVTDLKAEDIELLDVGRKQEILLSSPANGAAQSTAEGAVASRTFSNGSPDASRTSAASGHVFSAGTILLIDETHVTSDDLAWVRGQILKFMSSLPTDERVGLYTMTGAEFQPLLELTSDHSEAAGKIGALLAVAHNEPSAAAVHNSAASDADSPAAPFIALDQVARHLASIPGHKNLAWFLSERASAANARKENPAPDPRLFQALALHGQDSLNEAQVSVFPVNLAQTVTGSTADLASSSLDLAAAAGATANAAASAGPAGGSGSVSQSRPGSGITQMQSQDGLESGGVEGAIRELAEGTGGHAIPRSADLDEALIAMAREGRSAYQLRFVPQDQPDGRFHSITLRLTSRRGITLRSRTGYLSEQEPPTLKERFQATVWRPNDATGIALSAAVADASSSGNTIHLNIAASDLGMEQQTGRWMDKVDVFLIQRDDSGMRSHVDSQALVMNLKPETYQKSMSAGIPFDYPLELQPGMSSVRIVVVDNNSGRIGSVTIPSSALQPGGQAQVHTPRAKTP